MFYSIIFVVLVLDQFSKFWVRMYVNVGETFELWKGVLSITHYENSGVAFSLFQGYGRLFVPFAVLIIFIINNYRKKMKNKRLLLEIGFGFLVGGAIGNAIDRIAFNQVTDFISFHYSHGILNLSDYAINIGIIFVLVDMLISQNGKQELYK